MNGLGIEITIWTDNCFIWFGLAAGSQPTAAGAVRSRHVKSASRQHRPASECTGHPKGFSPALGRGDLLRVSHQARFTPDSGSYSNLLVKRSPILGSYRDLPDIALDSSAGSSYWYRNVSTTCLDPVFRPIRYDRSYTVLFCKWRKSERL